MGPSFCLHGPFKGVLHAVLHTGLVKLRTQSRQLSKAPKLLFLQGFYISAWLHCVNQCTFLMCTDTSPRTSGLFLVVFMNRVGWFALLNWSLAAVFKLKKGDWEWCYLEGPKDHATPKVLSFDAVCLCRFSMRDFYFYLEDLYLQ